MNNVQPIRNMTIDDILDHLSELDAKITVLESERKNLVTELEEMIADNVHAQLANKDYGCGTANVETERYNVKYVVSKKVKYDQIELDRIYRLIKDANDNPADYITISYDVAESKFKAWPKVIQDQFTNARTVETSKPRISYEVKE